MKTPDVFVIGAQKCGTTTLYADLAQHPAIALTEKESSSLTRTSDRAEAIASYKQHSPPATSTFVDVSTEYAMRPLHNVSGLAATIAPAAKIVYIVRDPVARLLSHHHHEISARTMTGSIDDAVREYPRLIDYSRYYHQLTPWIDAFSNDQVHVVHFEAYMSDRIAGANALYTWLGLPKNELETPDVVHNAASEKRVGVGVGGQLARSRIYRDVIRPRLPAHLKSAGKTLLLPKAPARPAPPQNDTLEALVSILTPDIDELARFTGVGPWWDLETAWLR